MAHIGVLSVYASGHLNPALSLGKTLHDREHKVTFFNVVDLKDSVTKTGLNFIAFGENVYPPGTMKQLSQEWSTGQGLEGAKHFFNLMLKVAETSFQELPRLIPQENIDLLVIDQLYLGGATIAQHLGLPYILLANVVFMNHDPSVPHPTLPLPYDPSEEGRVRNQFAEDQIKQAASPWLDLENIYRERWGLPLYQDFIQDSLSPLAQLTILPKDFDFPRENAPANLHHVGPLVYPGTRKAAEFPWDRLNGKSLIYASLGTVHNGLDWIYRTIMDACAPLDCQVVVTLGDSHLNESTLGKIPANVILVPYAPQNELLSKSALCITHAGVSTTLDALTYGVPIVAVPIGSDNPGVAARIQYTQTGEVIQLDQLNAGSLREAVSKVLSDRKYKDNAVKMQRSIAELSSLATAAGIVQSHLPKR